MPLSRQVLLSELNEIFPIKLFPCSAISAICIEVSASKICTTPLKEAVTMRLPSGVKVAVVEAPAFVPITANRLPSRAFHTRTVKSRALVMRVPS